MDGDDGLLILTYKDVGVDVQAIEKSQNKMGKLISTTHEVQDKARVEHGFGHYAGIVNIGHGMLLATHTDGVGTKVMIANQLKKYDTIGIDCVAMNVNDIICTGATPISFVDYIAASKNDEKKLAAIMRGLVKGAKKGAVPIVGGETAVMPSLFAGEEEFAFDLAGTVVGLVPAKKDGGAILGNKIRVGDVIIGAYSNGIHSNGYTLARTALKDHQLDSRVYRGGPTIGKALLQPTEIYVKPILELVAGRHRLHGLAHITGGSFTKLLRLKKTGYEIDDLPPTPKIMQLIEEQGVQAGEMYRTFNMGVGFCVVAPESAQDAIIRTFAQYKIRSKKIGKIVAKEGVTVQSVKIA